MKGSFGYCARIPDSTIRVTKGWNFATFVTRNEEFL